jgi:hypothetical protein
VPKNVEMKESKNILKFFFLLRWDRSKLSRDEEEELAKVFTR